MELTDDESERAKAVWAAMPPDMRELVTALVSHGMIDGRRGLARCNVGPIGSLPEPDPANTVSLADIDLMTEDERNEREKRRKYLAR